MQGSGACWPIHCPRRRLAITARQRADVDCAIPKFKARSTSCPSINALLLKTLAPTQQGPNCFPPEMDAFLDLVTGMSDNLEFA